MDLFVVPLHSFPLVLPNLPNISLPTPTPRTAWGSRAAYGARALDLDLGFDLGFDFDLDFDLDLNRKEIK